MQMTQNQGLAQSLIFFCKNDKIGISLQCSKNALLNHLGYHNKASKKPSI